MKFETIEDLNKAFANKRLNEIPTTVLIGEVEFLARETIMPPQFFNMAPEKKIIVLYTSRAKSSDKRLALVWGMNNGLTIHPILAKLIGMYRGNTEANIMNESEKKREQEEPTIGAHIDVVLKSFNEDRPIRGKVDTGATVCSLHADSTNIRKDPLDPDNYVVDFVHGGKKYTMSLEQHQSVQSADGGVDNRPVVSFTVKYEDKVVPDIMFNLNDRSGMDDVILIGMNLIKELGYNIDPMKEDVEHDDGIITEEERAAIVQEIEEDVKVLCAQQVMQTSERMNELYNFLLEQEVRLSDLLKYVKQDTISMMEKLEV